MSEVFGEGPSEASVLTRIYPWLFAALGLFSLWPLVAVEHPPLQDMPQHLAAIRVLRSYPDLELGTYFEISLGRTQYLAYYGIAWLLSFPLGVVLANKLVLCAALVSLPLSIAWLLRTLGRSPLPALLAYGFVYNAHLVLGFFNFIAALPLMFVGLALAVKLRGRFERRTAVLLSVVSVVCFYMHIVPFAFLGLGALLVLTGDSVQATAQRVLAFVPAGLATLLWLITSPAGQATLAATGQAETPHAPSFARTGDALRELPLWLTDVLHEEADERLMVAYGALLLVWLALGAGGREGPLNGLRTRLALLAPLSFVAYFVAPTGYDWIWPISARFPLIAVLFLPLTLPRLRAVPSLVMGVALTGLAVAATSTVGEAFLAFERDEVGDVEEAIAAIPPGKRVAGLVFARGSEHVRFSPFLHDAARYQAAKGGVVTFSFADFPQSPFRYRADSRPPAVPPRWEWMPERVVPSRDLTFYDYVLVRGGPGVVARDPAFREIFSGDRYRVYQRN